MDLLALPQLQILQKMSGINSRRQKKKNLNQMVQFYFLMMIMETMKFFMNLLKMVFNMKY